MKFPFRVIGVDPGKKGAMAVLDCYSEYINGEHISDGVDGWTIKLFDEDDYINLVDSSSVTAWDAYVENVHAMPGQGVVSMFNFGYNVGWIVGVLEGKNKEVHLVTPQAWKKEFGLIGRDKQASVEKCKELFRGVNLFPTSRSKVESDGMAEAMLIAEYGRRELISYKG